MRRRTKIIIAILIAVTIAISSFVIWTETPPAPMVEAYEALNSSSTVKVSISNWLVFESLSSSSNTGFIIYPGGRVDFRLYAPLAHAIAAEGYLVVIAKMPLNLAFFGVNTANDIIGTYTQIDNWAIGGHSLGGTMAAQFAYENPSKIKGLMLWAAYPQSGTDLSKTNLLVTTIHGTRDGLVSKEEIDNSLRLLPSSASRVDIVGGNHAQFGWYGDQGGDNTATITRQEQQDLTINATLSLLSSLV